LAETIEEFARRHLDWSLKTFGPGKQTDGLTAHIEKELAEIRAAPDDLVEWLDVMTLAMDGYLRHGGRADTLLADLAAKQAVNLERKWSAPADNGAPVEHDRSQDEP
jgi:hypothetical protein